MNKMEFRLVVCTLLSLLFFPSVFADTTEVEAQIKSLEQAIAYELDREDHETITTQEKYRTAPVRFVLKSIAQLEADGYPAGEAILALMQDGSWDIQIEAMKTLGAIKYSLAIPSIRAQLSNQESWANVYMAIDALARLEAASTVDAITPLKEHWHPAVREYARRVSDSFIHGVPWFQPKLGFEGIFEEAMSCSTVKIPSEDEVRRLYADDMVLERFSFPIKPEVQVQTRVLNDDGTYETSVAGPEVFEAHKAIRFQNGWLAGYDHGEWGGGLVYFPYDKKAYQISSRPVLDLHIYDDKAYFIGESYSVMYGALYGTDVMELSMNSSNKWVAKPIFRLPGFVAESWLVDDVLLVDTGAGSIQLKLSGQIPEVYCPKEE